MTTKRAITRGYVHRVHLQSIYCAASLCSTPPSHSLINRKPSWWQTEQEKHVFLLLSLSLLNPPHLVSMHWAKGKIKMEGGEVITCTLILERGATLAFTGCEMAEPFPKAAL